MDWEKYKQFGHPLGRDGVQFAQFRYNLRVTRWKTAPPLQNMYWYPLIDHDKATADWVRKMAGIAQGL